MRTKLSSSSSFSMLAIVLLFDIDASVRHFDGADVAKCGADEKEFGADVASFGADVTFDAGSLR